jgi:hypothetical protein
MDNFTEFALSEVGYTDCGNVTVELNPFMIFCEEAREVSDDSVIESIGFG